MSDSELKTFYKMFLDYCNHMSSNNKSILVRIYGIFKVKMEDIVPVNLILMENTVKVMDAC